MYETSKTAQVTGEMRRYRYHTLGIGEFQSTGSGCQATNSGSVILHSGHKNQNLVLERCYTNKVYYY